jgi:hypothetical protein
MLKLTKLSFTSMLAFHLFLTSCADFMVTAPLCGPGSADRSPMERFPASADGCYEAPSATFSQGSSIIVPMISQKREYILIKSFIDHTVVASSANDVGSPLGGLCKDPSDNTGRSFLLSSHEYSDSGWWSFKYIVFSSGWDRIFIAQAKLDNEKLKSSGFRFAMFPEARFKTTSKENHSYSFPPLGESLGINLIDNQNIPTSDLINRLGIEPTSAFYAMRRVPEELCRGSKMKFYQHKMQDLRTPWAPTRTLF